MIDRAVVGQHPAEVTAADVGVQKAPGRSPSFSVDPGQIDPPGRERPVQQPVRTANGAQDPETAADPHLVAAPDAIGALDAAQRLPQRRGCSARRRIDREHHRALIGPQTRSGRSPPRPGR